MYLIDHVAELLFVNWLIYVIKRIYTHTEILFSLDPWPIHILRNQ